MIFTLEREMLLIRADGNENIGMGHIMRCLSIADIAKDQGEECRFILADGVVSDIVKRRGFSTDILKTDYHVLESELEQVIELIEKYGPTVLLVDSYYVSTSYFHSLKTFVESRNSFQTRFVYIDDLASFAYQVDVLINYNIYGTVLDYEQIYKAEHRAMPQMFLGPQYAPLRKEFQGVVVRDQSEKVKNVLILTGGADPEHVALRLAEYAEAQKFDYTLHFVIGAMNGDAENLKEITLFDKRIVIHQNVQDMKNLMLSCDIAVSAAGSTQYELCVCGIPTINYVLADNQIIGAEEFCRQKIMVSAGDARGNENFEEKVFSLLVDLSSNCEKRRKMSEKGLKIVDGKGTIRLVNDIFLSGV
jgi:UDP-2,4-diacetamido-2,4,6-trideoxy-beta-L-altropyranose hydrolase